MQENEPNDESNDLVRDLLEQHQVVPILRHIVHDLNNSVWSVLGNIELVQHVAKFDDETVQELLASAHTSIERTSRECQLATRVLKTTTVKRQVIDLNKAVRNAVAILGRVAPDNVTITLNTCDADFFTESTEINILQIVRCLMKNSIGAIGEQPGTIRFDIGATDEHSTLSISDDGCGMDSETLATCKQLLYATDQLRLGLTTVNEIMQLHRGTMEIESQHRVGTTVRLHFPKSE